MGRRIEEHVPTLTTFDEVQQWLQDIVNHHNDVYPAILDIADFFNHTYRNTEEAISDESGVYYQINDSKIISVVYNNTTIDITYKTANNEERTIKFQTNLQRGSTEVNVPVIQLVKYKEIIRPIGEPSGPDGDFDPLQVGDAYISNNKLCVVTDVSGTTPLVKQEDLKVNVLYLRATGNKIYYYDGEEVHEFSIGGGGGSSVEFESNFEYIYGSYSSSLATSEKAVMAKDIYAALNLIWQTIMDSESDPGSPHTFEEFDAEGKSFSIFDYTRGNPGIFKIDKEPEDITVEDVEKAYTVKLPYDYNSIDEIPIIDAGQSGRGLWTAAKCNLSTTKTASQNKSALINALTNEDCIGLYLDNEYYIHPDGYGSSSNEFAADNPGGYKTFAINLPRDFIIVGDKTKGINNINRPGLKCRYWMFYTEHSLVLHNIKIHKVENSYKAITLNTISGINQLQITQCEFVSDDGLGNYIYLYSPNTIPYELEEGEIIEDSDNRHRKINGEWVNVRRVIHDNYIDHVYISNSKFKGNLALYSANIRCVKSFRVLNNTFKDFKRPPLNIEIVNSGYYSTTLIPELESKVCTLKMTQTKGYMSCPKYIAGNSFIASNTIISSKGGSGQYVCAAVLEGSVDYILHNYVANIVTAYYYNPSSTSAGLATYDFYQNSQQVYFANNYVKNIVKFAKSGTTFGISKSKSLNIQVLSGGKPSRDLCRYYKNNKFVLDKDEVMTMFEGYLESLDDSTQEYAYLSGITDAHLEKILSIRLCDPVYNDDEFDSDIFNIRRGALLKQVLYTNNIYDAGKGSIWGFKNNQFHTTANFECVGNTFIAKRFSNLVWNEYGEDTDYNRGYLFSVMLFSSQKYGNSVLNVKNNKFKDTSTVEDDATLIASEQDTDVLFINSRYYLHEKNGTVGLCSPEGDISIIENNTYEGEKYSNILLQKEYVKDTTLDTDAEQKTKQFQELASEKIVKGVSLQDSMLEILYGTTKSLLPITQPDNPEDGDKYISIVGGSAKVLEYATPHYSIIRFRFDVGVKTLDSDVTDFNIRAISFNLSNTESITPVTIQDLKTLSDTLYAESSKTNFYYLAYALGLDNTANSTDLKAALDNIDTSSTDYSIPYIIFKNHPYDLSIALQMQTLMKFIFMCNGYTFEGSVVFDGSDTIGTPYTKGDTIASSGTSASKFRLKSVWDKSLGRDTIYLTLLGNEGCNVTKIKETIGWSKTNNFVTQLKKVYTNNTSTGSNGVDAMVCNISSKDVNVFGVKAAYSRNGKLGGWTQTEDDPGLVGRITVLEAQIS